MFRYTADGGGTVAIPKSINPHHVLEVTESDSRQTIKNAFRGMAKRRSRQERAMASLAYAMITSKHPSRYKKSINSNYFTVAEEDNLFFLAAIGHTKRLLEKISALKSLVTAVNEHNHTLLYLAARSGFYDMTKALLSKGCPVNAQQVDRSTALHAASFYGHKDIVQLLLEHGADPTIKNTWNNTPEDEADVRIIEEVFSSVRDDTIANTEEILRKCAKQVKVMAKYNSEGELVGKEMMILDERRRSCWEVAWHGTKHKYLESICLNGLKPSGTQLPNGESIETQPGHYELGKTYFGIRDWAKAIFVSPSILYAAHVCYAERVLSLGENWAVLVKVYIKRGSYTSHDPTTLQKHEPIDGEPDAPEYRIPVTENDKILRVSYTPDVVVHSIMFVRVNFLDNLSDDMTYDEVNNIFR